MAKSTTVGRDYHPEPAGGPMELILSLPMEAKRQRANQAREALGRQVVPWTFGTPSTVSNAGHVQVPSRGRPTRGNASSKRRQSEWRMDGNTVDRPTSKHKVRHTDLTWDEFLHGYALPFSDGHS